MRFLSVKSLRVRTLGSRVRRTLGTPLTAEMAFTAPFDFDQTTKRLEVPPATTSTLPDSRASALAPPLLMVSQLIFRSGRPALAAWLSAKPACFMIHIE